MLGVKFSTLTKILQARKKGVPSRNPLVSLRVLAVLRDPFCNAFIQNRIVKRGEGGLALKVWL
jgi:hypothetical protein